ncbi:MAG TPA: hypothetical protein VFI25_06325 [Planctomycetota bacterium]|nr:hypothetical protein [Planctomycetota bacterium]
MRTASAFVALAGLLAGSAGATVSNVSVTVGGLGGFTSCGVQNPPTICDGVTPATAQVDFAYDDGVSPPRLTLVVTNTSPVTPGVANPVIRAIYFNTPAGACTGLTLVSQTGTAGATPAWTLLYDADLSAAPNPNGADGMGSYYAAIQNAGGVDNSIANALADTLCGPPGSEVIGPVTFEFDVTLVSGGATLTAGSFANAFSAIPPGSHQANVTMHFVAGGPNCDSGFITNPGGCAPGAFVTGSSPPGHVQLGSQVCFTMSGADGCAGCLGFSAGPGPIVIPQPPFPNLVVPLTPPVFVILGSLTLPPNTTVTACTTVPGDPILSGATFYFAVLQMDPGTGEFFISQGFSLTVD